MTFTNLKEPNLSITPPVWLAVKHLTPQGEWDELQASIGTSLISEIEVLAHEYDVSSFNFVPGSKSRSTSNAGLDRSHACRYCAF